MRSSINKTVGRVHFEDFSGTEFERLVFAYHVRAGWQDLAWYGQTGGDEGRDIIGTELFDQYAARRTVIQCTSADGISQAKAETDMAKAVKSLTGRPDAFKFVCGRSVSAKRRDAIISAARKVGITHVTVWSNVELEENLRLRATDILQRFIDGVPFPDSELEITKFVDDFPGLSDEDTLSLMAAVFERPAFRSPFHQESSLPAFLKAIEDTICALNTGVWRVREGAAIRRIPSVHNIRNPKTKAVIGHVVRQLDELRFKFVGGLRDLSIRPCGCGDPNCPTFMVDGEMARELDRTRSRLLETFRRAHPAFDVAVR